MEIQAFVNQDGEVLIRESDFVKVLTNIHQLILDQKDALRTKDRDKIANCKKREEGYIKFYQDYLQKRLQNPNIKF